MDVGEGVGGDAGGALGVVPEASFNNNDDLLLMKVNRSAVVCKPCISEGNTKVQYMLYKIKHHIFGGFRFVFIYALDCINS